ncbi:interferon-gamma-inducible GTPase 10-like [Branchiostoma floridae x Branchiostoma belcheri]
MGPRQSRNQDPDMTVLHISAAGMEIKKKDLGPEELEVFNRCAEKFKTVTGDQSGREMLQTLHSEFGQHVDENAWMEWMGQAYVRIGIIGLSGAGKSTFINSFRGLRARDPGAAAVGTTETTVDTTEYRHPEHDHVILVDFPGALFKLEGGRFRPVKFDMKEYEKKFGKKMQECNVFLVFTSGRVHDNPVWIAAKARDMGKKVLFVRSKFDQDVDNKKDDDPDYFEEGQEAGEKRLLQFQREDYVTKLETMGFGLVAPDDVFIISGKLDHIQRGRWDTPALKETILKQLDIQQQMLFITTCQDYSPTMAKAKARIYKSRAWKVALGVAAGGAIPFAGGAVNGAIMVTTIMLFKKGFGLDEASVRQLAALTGKDADELLRFVDERLSPARKITQFFQGDIDWEDLKAALTAVAGGAVFATAIAVDAVLDMVVPFVGGLVTAPLSFPLAWKALRIVIEQQQQCTLALYELAFH